MKKSEAAELMSIEEKEIHSVADSPAGTVVVTHDGVAYLIVPEDRPDAEGRHGLMYLAAPTKTYGGTFPVYANPGLDLDEVLDRLGADVDEPEPRPDDPEIPAGSPDDVAHPGVLDATAESHVATATGREAPSDPVPAPGPEHAEDVAEAEASPRRGRRS